MANGIVNVSGGASDGDLSGKADAVHKHTKSDITDFPDSMKPKSHASTDTDYGAGDGINYGHVKLSDSVNSNNDVSSGIAATPAAVKAVHDLAQRALDAAGEAKELTDEILHGLFGETLPDKTLENNSPDIIQKVARLGMGENFWSVGDKIGIVAKGTVGAVNLNDTYYAFIIGFNHNSALEGNGIHFQFGKDASGTDIAFVDGSYDSRAGAGAFIMNTEVSNTGGWESSYMRQTICPAFFSALPTEWQNIISPCTKYSDNKGGGSDTADNVTSTQDKIWTLSEFEIFGARTIANSAEQNFQKQYDYYKNGNGNVKYKHNDTASTCVCWTRSVGANRDSIFCFVSDIGGVYSGNSAYSYGFMPCLMVA